MADLYFHHYVASPFAEKIRLMFGHKHLTWHSVLQPSIMPKADLQALTGGYRRIPVLQIGNDIICDTALISDMLELLVPMPSLFPEGCEGAARCVAQWADSTLFTAAMAFNFQPKGAAEFFKGQSPEIAGAFAEDRKAMRAGSARMMPGDAAGAFKNYLHRIEQMLGRERFLFGAAPSLADFSCYHSLWFTRRLPALSAVFSATPAVLPWMDRMAALGQGTIRESDALAALAACKAVADASGEASLAPLALPPVLANVLLTAPTQDEHGVALGSQVGIVADSFGVEMSQGELIAASANHYTIRRSDPRCGWVRVHFPRVGFAMRAL